MQKALSDVTDTKRDGTLADRGWRALRVAFAIGMSIVAIWVAATTIETTLLRLNPVVNGDQWKWIELLQSWLEKGFSWSSLFEVTNEHRIAFFRTLLFADYLADHSTNLLLYILCLLEYIGTVAAFVGVYWWVTRDRPDWVDLLAYLAFITTIFFSGANLYNLTFGYQAGFNFGHIAIVLAALTAAGGIEASRSGNHMRGALYYCATAIIAFIATFSQSNDVFVWPLIFVMSWMCGVPKRYLAVFWIVGVATIIFFFSGFRFNTVMGNTDPVHTWQLSRTYLQYIEQFLGNIVVKSQKFNVWSYLLGLTGLIVACVAGIAVIRNRKAWTPAQLALVTMMGFVVITAWLIACARQGWGGSEAMVADRYRISSEIFWAAAIALILSMPWRSSIDLPVRVAVGLVMTFTAVNVTLNQRSAIQAYIVEGQRWELAANALRLGILDNDILSSVIWFPPPPAASVDFLRSRQLSVFADGRYKWIGQPLPNVVTLANSVRCDGSVESVSAIKGDKQAWRLAGRAWIDGSITLSQLVIVDEANKIIGLASAVITSSDLRPLLGDRQDRQHSWEGLTRGAPAATLTLYGIAPGGTTACKVATIQLPDK